MSDKQLISIDKSVSFTGGCQNKIGFVRTSSCNYDDVSEIEGYSLNCHQWVCPDCQKYLLNRLRDRITLGLKDKLDFFFFTLTTRYHEQDIKGSWARLRRILIDSGYPIDRFVWIMELTPPSHPYTDWKGVTKVSVGGLRHFHGLMSFKDKIPCKQEFSGFWKQSTKGKSWQVHIEKLWDVKSPAGYMSKYLTKGLTSGYHDRERRVGFSQNFPKLISTLEPVKGVYLSYDPRHPVEQHDDFAKMLEEANEPFKNKGKRFL